PAGARPRRPGAAGGERTGDRRRHAPRTARGRAALPRRGDEGRRPRQGRGRRMSTRLPVADAREVRRYAVELLRRHPRQLAAMIVLHAFAAFTGLAGPYLLGRLVQGVVDGTSALRVDVLALA